MSEDDARRSAVLLWVSKAEQALNAADRELAAGDYRSRSTVFTTRASMPLARCFCRKVGSLTAMRVPARHFTGIS